MSLTVLSIAYPLAPVSPDAAGGAEQVLSQIDRGLHASQHRSIVVACEGSHTADILIATPRPKQPLTPQVWGEVHRQHALNIERALREFAVDVIHMHGLDFHRYLPRSGPPLLVTMHMPVTWYPPDIFGLVRPDTWFNCVSKSQSQTCPPTARLLPEVENGVPVEELLPEVAKEHYALALGRICPEKNFHAALEAAEAAQIPLLLAGEVFPYEAHRRYFQNEIQPRLCPKKRFLGVVNFPQKRRLLSQARCLLQPSLCAETSSLVAMEALAAGTPVVAYASGALPEIVEHGVTGWIVHNPREMAEAIQTVHQLDSRKCREVACRRFSAQRMLQDYLGVYQDLLAKSRGQPRKAWQHAAGPSDQHGVLALDAPSPRAEPSLAATTATALETRVLTQPEELAALAPEWSRLWEQDLAATPFQSPEWLLPWWRHLGQGQLRVVTVREPKPGGRPAELVGLLPLYAATVAQAGSRKLLPLGIGTSDYLGGVFAPGRADACVTQALTALFEHEPDWGSLEIPNLRAGSPLLHGPLPVGLQSETWVGEPTLVLSLPEGAEKLAAVAPRSLWQNLCYYRRRAEGQGRVAFVAATAENLESMVEDLFRLHGARWSQRHQTGILADPKLQQAHREALPGLLARGLLRMYALQLDGRSCAVFYGLGDRRPGCQRVYYYLGGMDPQMARLSPGTLIIGHALHEALREGARCFDFLRGQEQYKTLWGATSQKTYGLRIWKRQ